ncbi:MAG: VWA domain-containing protein, partial [Nitrospinae bacterium]|nr:VWA domain-containing protein [Nitrospinota bacterium]
SATQFPDFFNARIAGKPATEIIKDQKWLENEFIPAVQKRGAAIIEARGLSSAASAANAVVDHVQAMRSPTPEGDWFSGAVLSDGSYGIPEGLVFGFPLRTKGNGREIVQGLPLNEFARRKIEITTKELQEERELTVMLLVDVSSSGEFGSVEKFKNEVAAEIASVLSYSAIKNNDKVGLIVFSDTIEHYIPPQKGRAHIWNLIRTILNFVPEGRHTNLNLPLEYLLKVQKRKSVAFLISDFQAEGYLRNLRLVRQKHDLIAIAITDPRESELPDVGWVHLEDSETGETLLVDTADRTLTEQLARLKIKERQERKKQFHANGVDVIDIQTDRSLTQPLIQFFKMREKRL